MQYLKADTAATILIGPFVDIGDGVTPETGITLGAADHAELMKHDGTSFVDLASDSRTFTHKEGGFYTLVLGTGDTDTEGRLTVVIMDTSVCLPVWKDFMVVNANVYDSLFASATTDYLQVDSLQVEGGDATDAINAACDASIETYKLDHLVSAADADDPVDDSIIAKLASKDATADWSDFDNTTDSLEAHQDGAGTPPSAASIADAVWDETLSDHLTAGDTGKALKQAKGRKLLD